MKLSVAEDTFVCRVYGLIVIATCWKIYCVRLKQPFVSHPNDEAFLYRLNGFVRQQLLSPYPD